MSRYEYFLVYVYEILKSKGKVFKKTRKKDGQNDAKEK